MAPRSAGKLGSCKRARKLVRITLVRSSLFNWAARVICFSSLFTLCRAETLGLYPVGDTTLIEPQPNYNNGGQLWLNAGTTQNYPRMRGLLQFDTSALPANAIIENVTLTLEVVGQPRDGFNTGVFGLHRMLTSWGEGTKVAAEEGSPGLGAPATAGEATWNDRFALMNMPWAAPGGLAGVDFSSAISSTIDVYGTGDSPYTFPSETGLIEDVQYWVQHPELNHGWMLKDLSEAENFTARRFATRESDFAPLLQIEYSIVPEPQVHALAGLGLSVLLCLRRKRAC